MSEVISTYKTIKEPSEGTYKEKGSKFFAFAYPVSTEEEIKEIQTSLRKEYYDARHHVFAWRLGADKKRYRASDDGEPANSSGPPVLGQIQSYDLTNILIVVIRYFGGTKLGIPGLINAYRTAAKDAIENAEIVTRTVYKVYRLSFDYALMNTVMKFLKDKNIEQFNQNFDLSCTLDIKVNIAEDESIISELSKIRELKTEYLKTI